MLIQPHILSLITTHRCTAACDHCCFSCHPERDEHVPVPNLHKYIEQAAEVDSIKVVAFTGGECFLLGKDLDELVNTASRNRLRSRFVSNGYWASSPRVATQRLQRLVDAGLDEANFSTGDMHSKYVRKENIINGAVAAAEMGLPTLIMVETFANSQFDFDGFVGDARLKPLLEAGRVSVKLSPWVKFEGQADLRYTEAYKKEIGKSRHIGCTTIMRVIAVNPSEHLIACCGLTLEEIEELHLGDLRKRSIGQILRETPDDFIKIWIHMQGPDAVIDYARSVDPTIQVPSNLAHICDICRFMYHHPRILKAVLKNPPPFRDDIVREYVMSLFRPVTEDDMEASVAFFQKGCSVDEVKGMRKLAID
jgi:hypothetical protein